MGVKKGTKHDGRSSDITFSWMTVDLGETAEGWRSLIAEWMGTQKSGVDSKISAMLAFTRTYLPKVLNNWNPAHLFELGQRLELPDLFEDLCITRAPATAAQYTNVVVEFIDWVIINHFTEPDDKGSLLPLVKNPFSKARSNFIRSESVHNPLPYAYIKELRDILCPMPTGSFSDWKWAHEQFGGKRSNGSNHGGGDWFAVQEEMIDHDDPDCIWRTRTVIKRNGKRIEQFEMWSPVRSVAIFVKLHLPLRTYQVRFLDSGEGDTWRYEQGAWVINERHSFARGTEKNPWNRGVFCRLISRDIGLTMTGLYVNTNKTADQNKDERERGYTIPWQHEQVLYWLERLRNWQEKYNPISKPLPCMELEPRHFGAQKSDLQRRQMGDICFLFRDASASGPDRYKPIPPNNIYYYWYRLLSELQYRVAARGQTLADGSILEFVKDYGENYKGSKSVTDFPLHSLRVSLLTCYAMEGSVPMPVLSKLLAGHSRLIMTLYYTKPSPSMMTQAMQAANGKVDAASADALKLFLRDADLRKIGASTAFIDEASLQAALANRNAIGWENRHLGLCLVGGNTVKSTEIGSVGGCWNGGELISRDNVYGPVPNGPENCVRCRWFITDARYLDALRGQFNIISYKASLAANLAVEHEQSRDLLLEARYQAQESKIPFMQQHLLEAAERRYEKQIVLADQYAKDLVACFQLICRIITIEENRDKYDQATKLVAVGRMSDIQHPISIIETTSELLQLSQICDDAELYPDLEDELRKTPALEKRTRALSNLLMQNGYSPVFMHMDDRMQLYAGNAFMRALTKGVSKTRDLQGFQNIVGAIKTGEELKLLPNAIEAIQSIWNRPVTKLSDLLAPSRLPAMEPENG